MNGPLARSILPSAKATVYFVPVWPSLSWILAIPRSAAFSTNEVADNVPAVPAPAEFEVRLTCAKAMLVLSVTVAAIAAVTRFLSISFSLSSISYGGGSSSI